MYTNKEFGLRLKALRQKHSETQKQLAELLRVKPNQICEMESGRKASTYEKLAIICTHYQVSADYLLCLIDTPCPWEKTNDPCPWGEAPAE